MNDSVTVKTVLKRGALVAAANWQVTAIQFVADVAHIYRNLGQAKAVMYVVTSHARIAS